MLEAVNAEEVRLLQTFSPNVLVKLRKGQGQDQGDGQEERPEKQTLKLRVSSAFQRIPFAKKARVPWSMHDPTGSTRAIKPNRPATEQRTKVSIVNLERIFGINNLNPRVSQILNATKNPNQQDSFSQQLPKIEYEPSTNTKEQAETADEFDQYHSINYLSETKPVFKYVSNTCLGKSIHPRPHTTGAECFALRQIQISNERPMMSIVSNNNNSNREDIHDFDSLSQGTGNASSIALETAPSSEPGSATSSDSASPKTHHTEKYPADPPEPEQQCVVRFSELHLHVEEPRAKKTASAVIFERLAEKSQSAQDTMLPHILKSMSSTRSTNKNVPTDWSFNRAFQAEATVAINVLQLPMGERAIRMPAHISKLKNAAKLARFIGTPEQANNSVQHTSSSNVPAILEPKLRKGQWIIARPSKTKRNRRKRNSSKDEHHPAEDTQQAAQDTFPTPNHIYLQNQRNASVRTHILAQAKAKLKIQHQPVGSQQRQAGGNSSAKRRVSRSANAAGNVSGNYNSENTTGEGIGAQSVPPSLIASIVQMVPGSRSTHDALSASLMPQRERPRRTSGMHLMPDLCQMRNYNSFPGISTGMTIKKIQACQAPQHRSASAEEHGTGIPLDASSALFHDRSSAPVVPAAAVRSRGSIVDKVAATSPVRRPWTQQSSTELQRSSFNSIAQRPPYELFGNSSSSSLRNSPSKSVAPYAQDSMGSNKLDTSSSRLLSRSQRFSFTSPAFDPNDMIQTQNSLFDEKGSDRKLGTETPGPWT